MYSQETILQQQLVTLRTRLLLMCASVGVALDDCGKSLAVLDVGRATAVMDGDAAVDALENDIDEMALTVLARNQPVAGDLRFVVSALRMVVDVERIGDEAVSIAEHGILLRDLPVCPPMPDVLDFLARSRAAYEKAVQAFRQEDSTAARALSRSEDEAVQAEVRLLQRCMDSFGEGRLDQQCFMHLILIIRACTRIWRRSANIAEHVYFIARGESLKHRAHTE